MKKRVLLLAVVPLILVGCTQPASNSKVRISVKNCGNTVNMEMVPQRVVLQNPASVETLAQLGVLDHVVAKAGYFPEDYFARDTNETLSKVPTLSDKLDETGHVEVSYEDVMAEEPDLIIGYSDEVNTDTVTDIPIVTEPTFCGEVRNASFEDINAHIDLYASLFNEREAAVNMKSDIAHYISRLNEQAGAGKSVAVVYPGLNGAPMYAYGKDSMAHPIVESVGLTNVFDDQQDRVAEITPEQLVEKNPDVIVVLHSDEPGAKEAVKALPGADAITAVNKNEIFDMHLAFAEAPTPLAVQGAKQLEGFLEGK
ncbi:ABC transporter substrate-binding protein [Corynebacterium breve]|uniref:ABC transporter substrate-binding protein n=1 Tax=Corynebacterium breve TaxID=3049799 RepID=A0ABY8VF21_9CORY|nr:ABC transporter substrate-binding protein [Corynebacterium breve]WIM67712.1 ABC transporter substrate-binding protein [Corynebacterium breve]